MSSNISFESLQKKYLKLIATPSVKEEQLHKFFVKYPNYLPLLWPYKNIVFSKFRLGNQFIADFAFAREDSPGVKWHFIEIENPFHQQSTRTGNPTKEFTHGLKQIQDWGNWFNNNRSFVEKNFPFQNEASKIGITNPTLSLIIGRRESAHNLSFLKPDFYNGIDIMSFERYMYRSTSPAVDLFKPIKVCSFINGQIKVISEFKMSNEDRQL